MLAADSLFQRAVMCGGLFAENTVLLLAFIYEYLLPTCSNVQGIDDIFLSAGILQYAKLQ
jgi:hypothetical protein